MRVTYGTTWWGNRWLASFLGGGGGTVSASRRAFKPDPVSEIRIERGGFSAVVAGKGRPCRVRSALPVAPPGAAERFAKRLSRRHDILARLACGELPPEMETLAGEEGLDLFPARGEAAGGTCTCADPARPCRHLVSAGCALVRRMEENPLALLELQGIDLPALLAQCGAAFSPVPEEPLPDARSFLRWRFPEDAAPVRKTPLPPGPGRLAQLLDPESLALPGGRSFVDSILTRLSRKAAAALRSREGGGGGAGAWSALERGPVGNGAPFVPWVELFGGQPEFARPGANGAPGRPLKEPRASGWFAEALLALTREEAAEHPGGLLFWHTLVEGALRLMQSGLAVPALCDGGDGSCRILWTPLLGSPVALGALRAADACFPDPPPVRGAGAEGAGRDGMALLCLSSLLTLLAEYFLAGTQQGRGDAAAQLFLSRCVMPLSGEGRGRALQLRRFLDPLKPVLGAAEACPAVVLRTRRDGSLACGLGFLPGGGGRPVMLKSVIREGGGERLHRLLNRLVPLGRVCPELAAVLSSGGRPSTLGEPRLRDFLFDARPALELLGARVVLPRRLRALLAPRLVARISGTPAAGAGFFSRGFLGDFSMKVALGGRELSPEEFEALARRRGEVVRVGEDYVWLDPAAIARIEERLARKDQPGYLQKLRAVLSGEIDGIEVSVPDDIIERIARMARDPGNALPQGLSGQLRPYQRRGCSWLVRNVRLGLGALLADDMGLGKTVQVLAAILRLKEDGELGAGKALVVVPLTLLENWEREVRRFTPGLSARVYHGPGRSLGQVGERPDLLITTYATLRQDGAALAALPWRLLVLDEVQAAKNASSDTFSSIASLGVSPVIAMTGTPMENRLSEFWSVMSLVQPGLLGSEREFQDVFARPIAEGRDPKALSSLLRAVSPFMLRRLKTDRGVIGDLPGRTQEDVPVTLLPGQALLYSRRLREMLQEIEIAGVSRKGAGRRRALVLKLISELKQICNSPSQFLKTWSEEPDSGKAIRLLELLGQYRAASRKVLVFTQYREMGLRLQKWIARRFGKAPGFLHGAMRAARRMELVDRFQADPDEDFLLLSVRAGGTGLNLTAATVVIHYDLWWNPAVENQASDRAWRIGQMNDVLIERLITAGTFEERISGMLAEKRAVTDLVIRPGEAWVGDLPVAELRRLFRFEAPAAPGGWGNMGADGTSGPVDS